MIREIVEIVISFLKSRFFPLILAFILMFGTVIARLFSLQIIHGDVYAQSVTDAQEKTMSVPATRGRIFDRNGSLLAYNDLAYSVKISDVGTYKSTEERNLSINEVINKTINLIEENGDTITNDLPIGIDEDGGLIFTETSESTLLRFKRDVYGAQTVSKLTEQQSTATAKEVFDYLCDRYEVSDAYKLENQLEIVNLRRYMSANTYTRYLSFTMAYEVSDETVASIKEHSRELTGVTVEEEYIRRYVDSIYTAHILGYTGNISTSELEELSAKNDQYEANDMVGKSGIEQSMELQLQGTKGSKKVYVDSFGRITEVVDSVSPQTGKDVYLTIDAQLQKDVYNAIEDELVSILLSKIVPGDTVYKYNQNTGSLEDIYIPVKSVYFALIDNNIVSAKRIAAEQTDNEAQLHRKYLDSLEDVINRVRAELTDTPTPYGKLSEEMQVYIYYIYDKVLSDNHIINKSNLDVNDMMYVDWDTNESVSLKEFLNYALANNWIDMNKLAKAQYSSLDEAYSELLDYITDYIRNDTGFSKKVYRYMIQNGTLSGREVCMLLYDQNVLPSDDYYNLLESGQMSAYDYIRTAISEKLITPGQLALEPCSGSAVIADPNTGEVLALVTYPGYDNNKLSGSVDKDYFEQLRNDKSTPLVNKATSTFKAPGSIFKMCSAIAGLEEGVITNSETIQCTGQFELVSPYPKCWIYPSSHGMENVSTAIRDSCNIFFYNVGYRLGLSNGKYDSAAANDKLRDYAEQLGLATKAGVELYEGEPHPSDMDAVRSAIGQGTHSYSALNLCRYISTVATSGVCHKFTLLDRVTDSEGNTITKQEPVVVNTVQAQESTWNAIHYGMQLVTRSTSAFDNMPYLIASKSGTAQENTKKADHITYVSYAPMENPQYAVSVMIPNGYSSSNAADLTAEIYKIIWNLKDTTKES